MFKVRLLKEDDYNILCEFWKWWKFPAPSKDNLPENGLGGIVVEKEGVIICAGFIYFTNSKMCWIEYIISNPNYKQKDRKEAINLVIDSLCDIAKSKGFDVAFTSVKSPSLIKRYEDVGFLKGSENTTEMVIVLR